MSLVEIYLKVWEIIFSALTPAAIVVAGYFINKSIKTREHELIVLRRKQDIRKDIYDEIGPKLNHIFCFVSDVGDFGYYEPQHIIDLKQEIHMKFKTYKKLWHDKTVSAYDEFMKSSFVVGSGGLGTPAKIRANTVEKKEFFNRTDKKWKPEWEKMFTDPLDKLEMSDVYDRLVKAFVDDMTSDKPV